MYTDEMETYEWYQQLVRPSWAPAASVFGPVWSVLYAIIAISFGYVFIQYFQKRLPGKVALPFVLNLVFNFAFTPIQFGLHNNLLAAVDIVLVIITLLWAMKVIYPRARWVAWAQIPYLLWGLFATALQFSITYLNW